MNTLCEHLGGLMFLFRWRYHRIPHIALLSSEFFVLENVAALYHVLMARRRWRRRRLTYFKMETETQAVFHWLRHRRYQRSHTIVSRSLEIQRKISPSQDSSSIEHSAEQPTRNIPSQIPRRKCTRSQIRSLAKFVAPRKRKGIGDRKRESNG